MTLYILMTESKNLEQVKGIISNYFDGYTCLYGEGIWKGMPEQNLTILIHTNPNMSVVIGDIAKRIKVLNGQETVLVLELEDKAVFV